MDCVPATSVSAEIEPALEIGTPMTCVETVSGGGNRIPVGSSCSAPGAGGLAYWCSQSSASTAVNTSCRLPEPVGSVSTGELDTRKSAVPGTGRSTTSRPLSASICATAMSSSYSASGSAKTDGAWSESL